MTEFWEDVVLFSVVNLGIGALLVGLVSLCFASEKKLGTFAMIFYNMSLYWLITLVVWQQRNSSWPC